MHRAAPYRFATWRRIDPGDRYTISAELAAGRPIAIAIPVTDSFYQQWGDTTLPVITGQSGAFHFSHSITGIGYSPAGVLIQNSWGPTWGLAGRAILSWSFLQEVGAEIVVSSSAQSQATSRKSQALSPELARIWGQYRAEHRLRAISYQLSAVSSQPSARKLTWAASLWKARADSARRLAHESELVAASRTGGIVWERFFAPRRRCRGRLTPCPPGHPYTEDRFQGRLLVWWNGRPGWWPQWHARRWLR